VKAYDAFRAAIQLADLWYARFGLAVAYIENGSFVEGLTPWRDATPPLTCLSQQG